MTFRERNRIFAVMIGCLLTIALLALPNARAQPADLWVEIGDIAGELRRSSTGGAIAMSNDGSTVAIGAAEHLTFNGQVRVFQNDGTTWAQIGTEIEGDPNDFLGSALAMSGDGSSIAIGVPGHASGAGAVQIYRYDGVDWGQVGEDIVGTSALGQPGGPDQLGQSVAMSDDGSVVVVSAIGGAGYVQAYELKAGEWAQRGDDLLGFSIGSRFGESVAIDGVGDTIAVGTRRSDQAGLPGRVQIYAFDGAGWNRIGAAIDGEHGDDRFGAAVALSYRGTTVAVGAPYEDQNGILSGTVRVFENAAGAWVQLGGDIDGESADDRAGTAIALSDDGSTVAIGAPNDDSRVRDAGQVRVFEIDNGRWNQSGREINGDFWFGRAGSAVAMSADGDIVGTGEPGTDIGRGAVHIFERNGTIDPAFVDGDVVLLRNVLSGRYLDSDPSNEGWNVDTSASARFDDRWRLIDQGDGTWALLNRERNRYLDADGAFFDWNVGQSLRIQRDDRWEILEQDDGSFALRNPFYGGRWLSEPIGGNGNVVIARNVVAQSRWQIIQVDS